MNEIIVKNFWLKINWVTEIRYGSKVLNNLWSKDASFYYSVSLGCDMYFTEVNLSTDIKTCVRELRRMTNE